VVTATCFALCAVSAFLIPVLFSVLSLLPNDNPDMRFLVLLRSLQVGLPCALAGLVLIPFAAKGGRVLACTAALLLLGQWYELGQIF
jgi:hypothetical protein